MSSKKKVLILSYGYLKNDARIKRQARALAEDYEVYTAGYDPMAGDFRFIPLNQIKRVPKYSFHLEYPPPIRKFFSALIRLEDSMRKINRTAYYENKYWTDERKKDLAHFRSLGISFDLIVSNDLEPLLLALALKNGNTKVIIDSHEYHPLEFEQDPQWMKEEHPYIHYLCKTYLPETDGMMTVSLGIVEEFKRLYGVDPVLVTNATEYYDLNPHPTDPENIRIVYHGLALPMRHLEILIEMMDYLDKRFSLALIFAGEETEHLKWLKKLAAGNPRISFPPPVPMAQLPHYTNEYDIGIEIAPPVNFNYKFGLGNKFFEFIQARLACAFAPMPEIVTYMDKYGLGVVSADFTAKSMAGRLNKLTVEDIMGFKQNAHKHALDLSAQTNFRTIRQLADRVLTGPPRIS